MKILSIFALFIMASFLISCSKDEETVPQPVANYSYNGSDLRAPVSILFTNASTNGDSYSWNF